MGVYLINLWNNEDTLKKEFFLHFLSFVIFSLLVFLLKRWVSLNIPETLGHWPFLLGGAIGTYLPDIDHLIYAYFLSPQDLTSQRVNYSLKNQDIGKSVQLLYETRYERTKAIFHTAFFQIIFLILTIFVFTSTASLFGKGLVLGFSVHLLIDELVDFMDTGTFSNWFKSWESLFSWEWDRRKLWGYLGSLTLILLLLVILF